MNVYWGNGKVFHFGRKVPKGWRERPGSRAMHMGRGIWVFDIKPCEKVAPKRRTRT